MLSDLINTKIGRLIGCTVAVEEQPVNPEKVLSQPSAALMMSVVNKKLHLSEQVEFLLRVNLENE